jgi:hypothetical protein
LVVEIKVLVPSEATFCVFHASCSYLWKHIFDPSPFAKL